LAFAGAHSLIASWAPQFLSRRHYRRALRALRATTTTSPRWMMEPYASDILSLRSIRLMGKVATRIFLRKRLKTDLISRKCHYQRIAESDDWHNIWYEWSRGPFSSPAMAMRKTAVWNRVFASGLAQIRQRAANRLEFFPGGMERVDSLRLVVFPRKTHCTPLSYTHNRENALAAAEAFCVSLGCGLLGWPAGGSAGAFDREPQNVPALIPEELS